MIVKINDNWIQLNMEKIYIIFYCNQIKKFILQIIILLLVLFTYTFLSYKYIRANVNSHKN